MACCLSLYIHGNSLPLGIFLSSADFFQSQLFGKNLSRIPSECQIVRIQSRPDFLSGLIWVKTVCKSYQQTTLGDKELHITHSSLRSLIKIEDTFSPSLHKFYNFMFKHVSDPDLQSCYKYYFFPIRLVCLDKHNIKRVNLRLFSYQSF